ncbi:MAG: hypothetical protein H6637_05195 [Ardenticatenales bacterium]|nr:hypothetical protein [Ardenticatenales bacterium]
MQTIIKIFAPIMTLLEESPSGKIDLHWREKLEEEIGELRSARLKNDILGALTEAADVAYYATKGLAAGDIAPSAAVKFVMDETAGMNLGLSDVVRACVAKYKLRFAANKLGVGKNDLAERRAVAHALGVETCAASVVHDAERGLMRFDCALDDCFDVRCTPPQKINYCFKCGKPAVFKS